MDTEDNSELSIAASIIFDSHPMQQTYPLSVVIPTLGGKTLPGTIAQLNSGTVVPAEILVCIPEEEAYRVESLSIQNVKVIKTSVRGQVAQRAIGFQYVQHPMVLQLDDDILLNEDALYELTNALHRLGHGNALSPVYNYAVTGRCIHKLSEGIEGWLKSLYACIVCGAPWGIKRMGVVTRSGFNYGVDYAYSGSDPFETQWLPGGCVLYYNAELLKECFYPLLGKAYCEDIIHSSLLKKRGLKLWVIPKAICTTSLTHVGWNWSSIKSDYKARCYFLRLNGGYIWRLRIWYIGLAVKMLIFMCLNMFKKNPPCDNL